MKFRPAPMDIYAKIVTFFVCVFLVLSVLGSIFINHYFWAGMIGFTALFITIAVSYSLKPESYELTKDNLIIHKPFGKKTILPHVSNTQKVRASGVRTFGVGGLFGYFGRFNGDEIWFVTNRKKAVKVISNNQTYLISPDNPSEFIRNFALEN